MQKNYTQQKSGNYTFDVWYYFDPAYMNIGRKVKYVYSHDIDGWHIKERDCYYENEYEIYWE